MGLCQLSIRCKIWSNEEICQLSSPRAFESFRGDRRKSFETVSAMEEAVTFLQSGSCMYSFFFSVLLKKSMGFFFKKKNHRKSTTRNSAMSHVCTPTILCHVAYMQTFRLEDWWALLIMEGPTFLCVHTTTYDPFEYWPKKLTTSNAYHGILIS